MSLDVTGKGDECGVSGCQKGLRFRRSRMAERDDGPAPFSRLVVKDSWEIKQELEHKSGNDYKAGA